MTNAGEYYKKPYSEKEEIRETDRHEILRAIRVYKNISGNYPTSPGQLTGLLGEKDIKKVQGKMRSGFTSIMNFKDIVKKIENEDKELK